MDKQTALKQIEEATAYLKSLETPVTLPPADRPRDGDAYYWLGNNGVEYPAIWNIANKTDYYRYEYGNCYLTLDAAEKAVAKQLATIRVLRKLRELEGDFVADWNDGNQDKHCVSFCYYKNKFICSSFGTSQYAPTDCYSSRSACEFIIENMQDDLKLMYGVIYD